MKTCFYGLTPVKFVNCLQADCALQMGLLRQILEFIGDQVSIFDDIVVQIHVFFNFSELIGRLLELLGHIVKQVQNRLFGTILQFNMLFNDLLKLTNFDIDQSIQRRNILSLQSILSNLQLLIQKLGALLLSIFS